jgi:hypothetical protein
MKKDIKGLYYYFAIAFIFLIVDLIIHPLGLLFAGAVLLAGCYEVGRLLAKK